MRLKVLTVVFVLLIVTVIVLADRGQLGFLAFVYSFPYGDKAGHFILFGILSLLVNLTFLRSRPRSNPRPLIFGVTALLLAVIATEEWSQRFFPQRTSDWLDLCSSLAGVALGAWFAFRWRK